VLSEIIENERERQTEKRELFYTDIQLADWRISVSRNKRKDILVYDTIQSEFIRVAAVDFLIAFSAEKMAEDLSEYRLQRVGRERAHRQ